MKDYSLTPKQQKAFKALEKAFKKCKSLNIYVWDSYGWMSAVNGDVVSAICPDDGYEAELDASMVDCFIPKGYGAANADDQLYVNFQD